LDGGGAWRNPSRQRESNGISVPCGMGNRRWDLVPTTIKKVINYSLTMHVIP
jgi:hypothetical protein